VDGGIVSGILDFEPGKSIIRAFDLLQTKHVGLHLTQISEELLQTQTDRIDVPGGDTHGNLSSCRLVAPARSCRKPQESKKPGRKAGLSL
jgi:hypothetical protein